MAAVAAVLAGAIGQTAGAIGEALGPSGPANTGVGYVVSNRKTQVRIYSSTVGLYFDENVSPKVITIANGNMCAVTPPSTGAYGDRWATIDPYTEEILNDYKLLTVDANENVTGQPASYPALHLLASTNPDANACQIKFALPNSYLTRSAKNGKYMVLLRAEVRPNTPNDAQNTFRVGFPSGGYVAALGINTTDTNVASALRVGYNDIPAGLRYGSYVDHSIPFGTACSVTTNTTSRISFFDTDNGVDPIQPEFFRVRIFDTTTNTTVGVSNGYNFTTVNADGSLPYGGGTPFYSPTSGSQTYSYLDFLAQPNHKYRLDIYHQHNVNTLQVTIPYDSIYSVVDCGNIGPKLDPSVTLSPSPTVTVGQTVTGTYTVSEVNNKNDGVADYARRMWIERGTNSTYDAGDTQLYYFGGSNFVFKAGASTTANFTTVVSGGNKICASYELIPKAAPGGMTTVVPPNPTVVCVQVAKFPKIQANGGDLYVGGKFGAACAVNPASAQIVGVDDANGDLNASFGDLAVTALGSIIEFGSRGLPPSNGSGLGRSLTFAYTPMTGNFMGANPSRCLNDPFTVYGGIAANYPPGTLSGLGPLGDGASVVRHYGGNLTITGNVTYQDKPYAFGKFPQVVILVDGDFIIDAGVSQLDGLYAVKGRIWTCNTNRVGGSGERVRRGGECDRKLQINGAVVVGRSMALWRTSGAEGPGPAINDKSEMFNLRPELYYGECQRVCNNGITTKSEQEAPVRF